MSIEKRLAALECSARRWRIAAVTLAVGMLALVGAGAAKDAPIQDVVRARKVIVYDDKDDLAVSIDSRGVNVGGVDRPAVIMAGDANSASLYIADAAGKLRMSAGIIDKEVNISLKKADGTLWAVGDKPR